MGSISVRITTLQDLEEIMQIYARAKDFMQAHGNPNQWTNYPTEALIIEEIKRHHSFICLNESDNIIGTFCFIKGEDPTYNTIEGAWLNNKPYATIHRIASSGQEKGVFKACVDWCLRQCPNLRIDTHPDNIPMQNAILKNGFKKCGIIRLADGSKRIAYQLTI